MSGTTTTNYTGTFFKLDEHDADGPQLLEPGAALDTSGLPATTVDPAIASVGGGICDADVRQRQRPRVRQGAPQAPFPAQVQLSIDVLDADGVAAVGAAPLGNPVTFGSAGGIPFTAGQEIRYGRVRVGTAVGSELVDLPVPMRAEYYASRPRASSANGADTCATNVSLTFPGVHGELERRRDVRARYGRPGASGVGCAAARRCAALSASRRSPAISTCGSPRRAPAIRAAC